MQPRRGKPGQPSPLAQELAGQPGQGGSVLTPAWGTRSPAGSWLQRPSLLGWLVGPSGWGAECRDRLSPKVLWILALCP